MSRTLREIADLIGGVVVGDGDLCVDGVRAPQSAGPNEIAAVLTKAEISNGDSLQAGALLVDDALDVDHPAQIRVRDARTAFVTLLELFATEEMPDGIHPRACVAADAVIGERVSIGPGACVESGARVGDRTAIGANTYVGRGTTIGSDCTIMPNVTICAETRIGNRVAIQSGTTIGADGFGFITLEDGTMKKIPQLGCVEIGDDVEIGANCCIDRATLEATVIGRGTKIDNLVQIGHNSTIGEDCCIVAQVGIAGSVDIGDRCILAGQAGISDHVKLGDGVGIGAQAGVSRSLASGVWIGSPAIPREIGGRVYSALEHLPDYRDRVRHLESRVAKLEEDNSSVDEDSGEGGGR